ncbi:uncharacterized protein CANTADRAFT_46067 [Suhomyces tanzawaensis NRRL Y-17324]|uniref:Uncharacterized protein n=1 Tax=Suhomyces tanzawaensis NRRL Y-17324 TaxID=984487 RepID=A0A1E4SRJ0_9ASCO|nr:uncharacterized protein CANTADRAFT_46067 [Suhomyces tanzawaensis NRRL Y-17324]ODV82129.1 hypothetical protein CANTADRAFT_46067 [Suhomyces tanzawaensis NRRL Y-17324]
MLPRVVSRRILPQTRAPIARRFASDVEAGEIKGNRFKDHKLEETPKTSGYKPHPHASAGITNGTAGKRLFPTFSSAYNSYKQEIPKAFGALAAIGAILLVWPALVVKSSNFIDDVPQTSTAAVTIDKFGLTGAKPVVDIPQTYSRKDKPADDDE